MNSVMIQRLLKYAGCFLCTFILLTNIARISFPEGKNEEAISHNAGKDCLASGCHASGGWKLFSIAGTIYTDAEGTDARRGAQIKAVDANGIAVNLTSDQIGNFYSAQSMTAPFMISVSYRGRKVKMPGIASGGGCNADGCHTVGSAGRVYVSTEDLDLTGTVTGVDTEDSTDGIAIANAKISLSRKGHIKYRTTTDSAGAFTMKKVKANDYTLKVARKGYKTYKQPYEMKQRDVSPLKIMLIKK
ncbi:MAG: carboxypeptidase regulatory-like domain-containing protein [Candidatus Brocadia sp.]